MWNSRDVKCNQRWAGMDKYSKSLIDFNDNFVLERGHIRNNLLFFLFGTVCWTLWLNRNNWIFRDKLISSPRAIIFRLISFMQQWKIISLEEDQDALEQLIEAVRTQTT
jgi:hypothetical protein